ncbi:MAG: zinc-binding dehydrogenase [Chloroflexi bacterium]|nr:zinc-binding dehydrogenase [Chloroflexota bacterium]
MVRDKMKAVCLLAEQEIEIREVNVPSPGTGEVLVKVRAAITCGTDVKIYRRGHPKFPPPFVFGHEFAGDIVAVGDGVKGFEPGMRVTANVFAECGECFYCQRGQGNLCENLDYNFGSYAEYNLIPASIVKKNLFIIPDHLSYAEAAIVEPLVCVVHAANLVSVQPGEQVIVIGAGGPLSLLFIQLARLAGASSIIAVGHSDFRLSIAQQLGADIIINSKNVDAEPLIANLTKGRGADVVIECAGSSDAWEFAVSQVRKGGRVLWFGGLPGGTEVRLDAAKVHYGEITLYNAHGGTTEDAHKAFELISSGQLDVRTLITHEMPLEEIEQALQKMISGDAVKVAIIPE